MTELEKLLAILQLLDTMADDLPLVSVTSAHWKHEIRPLVRELIRKQETPE